MLLLLDGILGCAETWDRMMPRVVDRFPAQNGCHERFE